MNHTYVFAFKTPRGWRTGVRVEGASLFDIAETVSTSNYFKPVEESR